MALSLLLGIIGMCIHMMALTYLTALSLSTVTHIKITWTMIMLNGIAILYTMMGGMKAVIWTDVLQVHNIVLKMSEKSKLSKMSKMFQNV